MTDFSALKDQVRDDPYPLYAMLRQAGPIHWSEQPRGWLITRYEEVSAVLSDPRLGSDLQMRRPGVMNSTPEPPEIERHRALTLIYMDPPEHTRARDRVRRGFTSRSVARMRPRIEAIADELIDAVEKRGEIELIADFAYPLPVRVITELLGLPTADLPLMKRWSDDTAVLLVEPFKTEEMLERSYASLAEMRDYFARAFALRRSSPQDDLISQLVDPAQEDPLADDELFALVSLMLVAGHETTTNLIGNSILALLEHPEARRKLQAEPARIPDAVEELLRYNSPVQVAQRIAREDLEIAGQLVRAGERVFPLLASANRDPEVFPEPNLVNLERGEVRHLSFGQGVHFCLGASLARLEGAVALAALLRRLPGFKADFERPVWRSTVVLRGVEALPLRF